MDSSPPCNSADVLGIPVDWKKIGVLREAAGLSQVDAAQRAGVSRQNWNDIERGRRKVVTIRLLDRIAAALGVSARDLLK